MYDNLYCKVFIDTNLSYEELFTLILVFINGEKQAVSYISTRWCDISVQKNKEFDAEHYLLDPNDFLCWKYYLDIEPKNIEESAYIKKINDLIQYIKKHCNDTVVACDFEEELINTE